jgi:phage N-6-adenine-methyltransferase
VTVLAGFGHEEQRSPNADWYTPKWLFDRLGVQFDLDPCQPEGGIDWIPAASYYSIHEDGLIQRWEGRVWLNPPYGRATPAWLDRMHRHRNGIALLFARTDCAWFHDYVAKADAILFIRGRVRFVDGLSATKGTGAGSGSMLIAWGQDNVDALKRIKGCGHIVYQGEV